MSMYTKKKLIAAAIVFLLAGEAWANVIRVPQDYSNIQSAIEAAVVGDTILVSPGIYRENIDFVGKDIVLGSLFLTTKDKRYLQTTVIDADSGSVVTFVNRETQNALLCGFTITGGTGTVIDSTRRDFVGGAGILIRGASPVIRSNLITRNSTWPACFGFGGGIAIMDSSNPLIVRNAITANDIIGPCAHLLYFGGGIWIDSTSNPMIGGSLENANDIHANSAADCIQIYCQGSGRLINAQYNYWGECPPGAFAICSDRNIDFTQCLNVPVVKVDEANLEIPSQFQLLQNYPNPFTPETTIKYTLPKSTLVKLVIYDMLGREVKTLVNELQQQGVKSVVWDGKNNHGQPLPNGLYLYRIVAEGFTQSSKSILLK